MAGALGYWPTIQAAAGQYDLDPRLIAGVVQTESSGDPSAYSSAGAMGLMQLMPATAQSLGVADPYNPTQNIYGGAALLRENLDRYGDVNTALLAYHGGTNQNAWGPRTQSYPGKVMENIRLLFGGDNQQVLPDIAPVAGAHEMAMPAISDFSAPDFSPFIEPVPTPAVEQETTETESAPWYRVDKHVGSAVGKAYDKVVDTVTAPVEAAGNYALRGVVILAAVVIVGLGLYFLFKEQIDSAALKMLPLGKAAKAVGNVA